MGQTETPSNTAASSRDQTSQLQTQIGQFERWFGFKGTDLSSCESFYRLMCRPTNPSLLGWLRAMFGFLMLMDIWQERGWGDLVELFGDKEECRFPFFTFLTPLPLEWMYVVYLIMCIEKYDVTSTLTRLIYKEQSDLGPNFKRFCRTNHEGWMMALQLATFNELCLLQEKSIDGILFRKKKHAHIPLWNYAVFRFQIFLLYFYAGLKKLDLDWVSGYSMHNIAGSYVFAPFKLFLSEDQIGYFVVHLGGLTIDLLLGFLLFFDATRKIAFLFGASFHLMNSQIFSIGMFPWLCLATLPIFSRVDWPQSMFRKLPMWLWFLTPEDSQPQRSSHCIYKKDDIKPETNKGKYGLKYWNLVLARKDSSDTVEEKNAPPTRAGLYHKLHVHIMIAYVCVQCLLPYSHGITKGYNNWTNGLYGYSWDMMVHNWQLQHIKITYVNKDTGQEGYLNPSAWVGSGRWSSHADMVKQYASCVQKKFELYGIPNIELYVDVWRALNDRFQQRTYDPRVNLLEADWSPMTTPSWTLPLLVDLSDWRDKLAEIERSLQDHVNDTDVVFVADFPGMYLENFLPEDLGNTSITILKGEVIVELVDQGVNITLQEGNKLQLPVNEFHNVHTVSSTPSCYMYIYVNTTELDIKHVLRLYNSVMDGTFIGTDEEAIQIKREVDEGDNSQKYQHYRAEHRKQQESKHMSLLTTLKIWASHKLEKLSRSFKFTLGALVSLYTGSSFDDFLNATLMMEHGASFTPNKPQPSSAPTVQEETFERLHMEEEKYIGDL